MANLAVDGEGGVGLAHQRQTLCHVTQDNRHRDVIAAPVDVLPQLQRFLVASHRRLVVALCPSRISLQQQGWGGR